MSITKFTKLEQESTKPKFDVTDFNKASGSSKQDNESSKKSTTSVKFEPTESSNLVPVSEQIEIEEDDKQKLLNTENVNTITETSVKFNKSNKKERSKLKKVVYI